MNGKILRITWQRLLQQGETCPRCGATETEVEAAVATLGQALTPLGIAVVLEKTSLSLAEFEQGPLQSNLIRLNGRVLEEWLGATTGQSPCCEVCGPHECRTVGVGEAVYETIPAELIVKAGLLAAAEILEGKGCGCDAATGVPEGGCCAD